MKSFSLVVSIVIIIQQLSCVTSFDEKRHRAECQMWGKLENRTLPLQNQGHADCAVNKECTGFMCKGQYQKKDIAFGMRVMPCQQPPGVEIYGSAPQFNAKNFSHIFTHKAEYEVPGALLNVSMLPEHVVGAGPLIKGLKGRLEVHLTVNHDNNTLTLGLTAKACVNSTCLFSKPVFNRTEIPVPECTNKITSNEPKANSACKLSDITACGVNQACQQTDPKSPWGICTCLSGYSLQDDNTCELNQPEGPPKPKRDLVNNTPPAVKSNKGPELSAEPRREEGSNNGTIAAVAVSLMMVLVLIGVGFIVATKTTVGTRLRARLTNTPYGDIAVSDRGQMMGSTTSVGTHNTQSSNRNVFA